MNIIDYAIISNKDIQRSFETLTDNNFHNDTSILNCYIALGFLPYDVPERENVWTILEELKRIDRKNYTQGFLRFEDLEKRNNLDKELEKIVNGFLGVKEA